MIETRRIGTSGLVARSATASPAKFDDYDATSNGKTLAFLDPPAVPPRCRGGDVVLDDADAAWDDDPLDAKVDAAIVVEADCCRHRSLETATVEPKSWLVDRREPG